MCVCVCLNKFPKPPNFIGVFFGFSVGNLFGFEDIGTLSFEGAKVRKKWFSRRENIFFDERLAEWEKGCIFAV